MGNLFYEKYHAKCLKFIKIVIKITIKFRSAMENIFSPVDIFLFRVPHIDSLFIYFLYLLKRNISLILPNACFLD